MATPLQAFCRRARLPLVPPLHLVLGNEAADVDSIACAVVLAFISQPSSLPLVNTLRADLRLRRDALVALRLAALTPPDILFLDDLPAPLPTLLRPPSTLTLVDHNTPAPHQCALAPFVAALVDHHADHALFPHAHPRLVHRVASCATLVAEMLAATTACVGKREPARLLACAVLLDTANMAEGGKGTPRDANALRTLAALAEWDAPRLHEVYKELKAARNDLAGFSAADMVRRDLKVFEGGGLLAAVPTVATGPHAFVRMGGGDVVACLRDLERERGVDCVVVLMSYRDKGEHRRDMAMTRGEVGDALHRVLLETDLGLQRLQGMGEGLWWFSLIDPKMSRKVMGPTIGRALEVVAKERGESRQADCNT